MADVSLDVLAIAAHPDDAEITCGGLLIKMAQLGRSVGILDLTQGEMGTYGDENDRLAEAAKAAEIMGMAFRENCRMPDSAVEVSQENKLKIAGVLRQTTPELVVLPHWEQRHPDHRACSQLGYDACFLAGLEKAPLVGAPFRPRKIIYVSYYRNREFSFLVDISEAFTRKIEAVAAYESQFGSAERMREAFKSGLEFDDLLRTDTHGIFDPTTGIYDLMHIRHRQLGQMAGVRYAEAYTVKESILIDDPQTMPIRSI